MKNKLYIVDRPRKNEYAEAALIDTEYDYDRYVRCPQCGAMVSGAYWKRPREVVLTGRKVPDFLYAYCDNAPFLLSKAALERIQAAGLEGINIAEEIESVRFQRQSKYETPIPTYYHVELAWSRISIDHPHSKIIYGTVRGSFNECLLCRQIPYTYDFIRHLEMDLQKYEGYDIFHVYEMGHTVFLSSRFVDFYKESGLTGLCFDPMQKHGQWATAYFLDGDEDA